MADRFPLVANSSTNQIQEIPSGDNLNLDSNGIVNVGVITASGFSGPVVAGAGTSNIVSGIATLTQARVGGATTFTEDLVVTGNARVTGILTIGTGSLTITDRDINASGVTTASNFKTGSTNVHSVGVEAAGINVQGGDTPIGAGSTIYNSGAAVFTGIITAPSANFTGNVSIGGTLTYEDVTNIDSVGVITARQGIVVVGGGVSVAAGGLDVSGTTTLRGVTSVNNTFQVDGNTTLGVSASDNIDVRGRFNRDLIPSGSSGDFVLGAEDKRWNVHAQHVTVGGISTFAGLTTVTSPSFFAKQGSFTGVVTASSFKGDGSQLTGVTASGTGIVIKDNGSAVGTAGTIDFSTNLDVTFNSGIATIVTNVDTGINTTGNSNFHNLVITGVTTAGIITGATYYGDGSNLTGVGTQGANVQAETLTVSGVSTFSGNINANGTLTVLNALYANGNLIGDGATNISGINSVTATSFYGSGANLSNVTATGLTTTASVNTTGIITAASFYGDGSNLTGTGGETLISGITVQEESSTIGTAGSITTLDFQGASITATASGANKAIITVTDSFSPDGQENLFAGTNAGACKDSDTCFNVGVGYSAGFALNAGDNNVLIGRESGSMCLTTGSFNVFLGCRTGQFSNSTCSIFMGNYAGRNTNGTDNIFLGSGAGRGVDASGKDGCNNIALGQGAGFRIDEGDHNIFIGQVSGSNTQAGGCNVFLGWCSGRTNTIGTHNIAIGMHAYAYGDNGFAIGNVLLGRNAGKDLSSGNSNVVIGDGAGCCLCQGTENTLVGAAAGLNITNGDYNVILGAGAGRCLTTGCYNILHGLSAGRTNVTGNDNIAIGRYAGYGSTSIGDGSNCHNISMGLWSGRCLTTGGNHNIQFGCYTNRDVTTGSYNIAIGHSVGVANSTGDYQLAIGQIDDRWITGDSSFNVSLSGIATITKSTGQFEARSFKGDGANITGIVTAGSALATGIATGVGTFTASAGVSTNIDSFAYGTDNYKTAEYTVHIENGANTQAQKVLIMQNGTTALSQEYAIMFSNSQLISAGSTISSGNVLLQVTPETGISGLTTYRWRREVQL